MSKCFFNASFAVVGSGEAAKQDTCISISIKKAARPRTRLTTACESARELHERVVIRWSEAAHRPAGACSGL